MMTDHFIWVEKFRPKELSDYIGNDTLKTALQRYITEQDLPHLLFYGTAGTGKTTAAKLLTRHIDCDALIINASDENSVETIRQKVKTFASSIGFKELKIIVLDEADFITPQGQAALRNMMEAFSKHTRFVLTANYKERIIEPIVSRTQVFEIVPPSRKDVAMRMAAVLDQENVTYDPNDLVLLINASYPDIRAILQSAQQFTTAEKKLVVEKKLIVENDYKLQIISLLQENPKKAFTEIRQLMANARVRDFTGLYRLLFDSIDDYAGSHVSEAILAIADGQYKDAFVVDKEINAMATIANILTIIGR